MCSSTLLTTRLDIVESVTKNIGTSTYLRREAQMNTQSSGEPLSREVINLTDAIIRSLGLAFSDFKKVETQEGQTSNNPSIVDLYGKDADDMYMSAFSVIRSTVDQISNAIS